MESIEKLLYSKFSQNCQEIPKNSKVLIAVSGGSDSLGMLFLAKNFFNVIAATVDHGIRRESKEEALYVADLCRVHGIEHKIFSIFLEDIEGNLQSNLRAKRYEILIKFCKENKISYIFTGHQIEDIVENLFLKIYRNAGVKGFSNNRKMILQDINIIRPLFNFTKMELEDFLKNLEIKWINDPSNDSDRFLRNRIRKGLNEFFRISQVDRQLFQNNLVKSFSYIEESYEVLDEIIKSHKEKFYYSKYGFIYVDFAAVPKKLLFYVLKCAIEEMLPSTEELRGRKIERIIEKIYEDHAYFLEGSSVFKQSKFSLSDLLIEYYDKGILLYKSKESLSSLFHLSSAKTREDVLVVENSSFSISGSKFVIEKLSYDEYVYLRKSQDFIKSLKIFKFENKYIKHIYQYILFNLPVVKEIIKKDEKITNLLVKVVAIPHINYIGKDLAIDLNINFETRYKSFRI